MNLPSPPCPSRADDHDQELLQQVPLYLCPFQSPLSAKSSLKRSGKLEDPFSVAYKKCTGLYSVNGKLLSSNDNDYNGKIDDDAKSKKMKMIKNMHTQGNKGFKSRNGNGSGHATPGKHAGSGYIGGFAGHSNGNSGGYAGHSNDNTGGYTGHANGNTGHPNGKQAALGKQAGNGFDNGKKFVSEIEGNSMGKNFKVSSNAKAKNVNSIVVASVKNKGNGILLDVTNQNITPSNATPKTYSQKSKKISKQGKKLTAVLGPLEVNRNGVDFYKKSFGLDKVNSSPIPTSCEINSEVLDNAAVLRQLHSDVSKFDGNGSDIRGTEDGLSNVNELEPTVDNFDKVASDLKEAMEVILELFFLFFMFFP
ncbi:hypothetical protein Q3G72_021799 [Acer saccharum]|nr:hypothetical protein Q3G72_021799 [Acer saccharum]